MTEAQRRAKNNYRKKCYRLTLEFYPGTDIEVIDYLKSRSDAATHVKNLVRSHVKNIDKT